MARDRNAQERIETILYHSEGQWSGDIAQQIYEEEVKPLHEIISQLAYMQAGNPHTGSQADELLQKALKALKEEGRSSSL